MSENIEHTTLYEPIEVKREHTFLKYLFPLLLSVYLFAGFTQIKSFTSFKEENGNNTSSLKSKKEPKINFISLLTLENFSANLRDTVFTDKNIWLELRIDEQKLYVHYRSGKVKELLVSSGNKFLNKGIESRPGLFAIFHKEELHLSSQFDDAKMYYYMPFNMGIGFHALAGTGYYGNLGVRPSSHGCIRMRHEDVSVLFKECDIGTIVLAHRGKTARVVAFAPEGFQNDAEYDKAGYMKMLGYNLNSIYEGKYFINQPKRFIIDPSIIPRNGFNVGNTDDIPETQQVPYYIAHYDMSSDRMTEVNIVSAPSEIDTELAEVFGESGEATQTSSVDASTEIINKLVYNPGGILPYFPPNK